MKFKLTEEYHEDTKYLHRILNTGVDSRGQISLRKYLFANRYHLKDDPSYVVHHIDGNHENYNDDNIALMKGGDHTSLHKVAKGVAVKSFRILKLKSNPQFDFLNLSDEDVQVLKDLHSQACKNLLKRFNYK